MRHIIDHPTLEKGAGEEKWITDWKCSCPEEMGGVETEVQERRHSQE